MGKGLTGDTHHVANHRSGLATHRRAGGAAIVPDLAAAVLALDAVGGGAESAARGIGGEAGGALRAAAGALSGRFEDLALGGAAGSLAHVALAGGARDGLRAHHAALQLRGRRAPQRRLDGNAGSGMGRMPILLGAAQSVSKSMPFGMAHG